MRLRLCLRHVAERAHVVQAVGQLDQHDAHVVAHGQEGLAQCFEARSGCRPRDGGLRFAFGFGSLSTGFCLCMLVVARDAWQVGQFGDAVHQGRDRSPKSRWISSKRDGRIFHRIMQQSGRHHFGRDAQVGKDLATARQ